MNNLIYTSRSHQNTNWVEETRLEHEKNMRTYEEIAMTGMSQSQDHHRIFDAIPYYHINNGNNAVIPPSELTNKDDDMCMFGALISFVGAPIGIGISACCVCAGCVFPPTLAALSCCCCIGCTSLHMPFILPHCRAASKNRSFCSPVAWGCTCDLSDKKSLHWTCCKPSIRPNNTHGFRNINDISPPKQCMEEMAKKNINGLMLDNNF
jgi:hypothetical protein